MENIYIHKVSGNFFYYMLSIQSSMLLYTSTYLLCTCSIQTSRERERDKYDNRYVHFLNLKLLILIQYMT